MNLLNLFKPKTDSINHFNYEIEQLLKRHKLELKDVDVRCHIQVLNLYNKVEYKYIYSVKLYLNNYFSLDSWPCKNVKEAIYKLNEELNKHHCTDIPCIL